ncbi:hypothetical protein GGR50DRAFT_677437 [Xylaria sp. CBS 124048]|nr:hypothetical protein GGR50DRAFT_677437 [Xylaria sp. CBS 124048]
MYGITTPQATRVIIVYRQPPRGWASRQADKPTSELNRERERERENKRLPLSLGTTISLLLVSSNAVSYLVCLSICDLTRHRGTCNIQTRSALSRAEFLLCNPHTLHPTQHLTMNPKTTSPYCTFITCIHLSDSWSPLSLLVTVTVAVAVAVAVHHLATAPKRLTRI